MKPKFMLPCAPTGYHVRCELNPATDHWMRGDRYGHVMGVSTTALRVLLDKSGKMVTVSRDNVSEIFNCKTV